MYARPVGGALVGAALLAVVAMSACSSSDGGASPTTTTASPSTSSTAPASRFDPDAVGGVTIDGPITTGDGKIIITPVSFDVTKVDYTEEEFFVSGTASSFTSAEELTTDGEWTVEPADRAHYTTRIVVRRPADPADFNGTVYVEWLNVTGGVDAAPDWAQAGVGITRAGAAWVGVSAQLTGIEGEGGLGAALRLKNADPVRYGPLVHPGDSFSYDLFSQVGGAVHTHAEQLLGGATPERVYAIGESQSAFRLNTYVDAVQPLQHVYDGFFIHSRAEGAAELSAPPQAAIDAPSTTLIRTDLDVPVLIFETETDVSKGGLGYAPARQDDTDAIRTWEVAGTAHYDTYGLGPASDDDGSGAGDQIAFDFMLDPPHEAAFGIITCDTGINTGPQMYVARAALAALDHWSRTGEAPAPQDRLQLEDDDTTYAVDDAGNALGGVRTPQVDVPVATLSGLGQGGTNFCGLFGTTVPLTPAQLAGRYASHRDFVEQWSAAVDAAVGAGTLLEADAENLKQVAADSSIGR